MASGITLHSSPETPTPCYNEQWFVADSSHYAATNFKYTIYCEDVLTGFTRKYEISPNPSGKLEFNAQFFAEQNMANYIPINQYGWKKCSGAIRKIRVNIGETYGSTPSYTAGSDVFYYVWNSAIETLSFASYGVNGYVYDATVPVYNYLTGTGTYKTFINRSDYLYVLAAAIVNQLTFIGITTYDSSGNTLGVYSILRPDSGTGLQYDNYQCIDIGYKGMLNIPSPQVIVSSGTYPIIQSNVASYNVYNGDTGDLIRSVKIECEPQYTVYSLHYLNRKGGFDTLHCSKVSELSSDKVTSTSKKNPWTNVSNVMTFDTTVPIEKIVTTTSTDKIRVNSDWLTQTEFTRHKDLFTSPLVYLDLGSSSNYIPVKILNNSYLSKNNDRLRNLVFDLAYTNDNHSQRG